MEVSKRIHIAKMQFLEKNSIENDLHFNLHSTLNARKINSDKN
jgi:hypothetical protein